MNLRQTQLCITHLLNALCFAGVCCMCRHDGMDWPSDRTINATPAAAQQVIKELEQELARLPPTNPQQSQQQTEQRDGPHAMLARAIHGFRDGLAAFEKTVKESRELEAERNMEARFYF
jgi:hypothetical protein